MVETSRNHWQRIPKPLWSTRQSIKSLDDKLWRHQKISEDSVAAVPGKFHSIENQVARRRNCHVPSQLQNLQKTTIQRPQLLGREVSGRENIQVSPAHHQNHLGINSTQPQGPQRLHEMFSMYQGHSTAAWMKSAFQRKSPTLKKRKVFQWNAVKEVNEVNELNRPSIHSSLDSTNQSCNLSCSRHQIEDSSGVT